MTPYNQDIEQRLAKHPFLTDLEARHIVMLARSAIPTRFDTNQLVFKAGEPANGHNLGVAKAFLENENVCSHHPSDRNYN